MRGVAASGLRLGLGLPSRADTLHRPKHPAIPPIWVPFRTWLFVRGVGCEPGLGVLGGLGTCDLCPPRWVIKGFMRPCGRPAEFPRGEIMHLNVGPARPCTLKGPLVLQGPAVSTQLVNGSWFYWPLLPGQRPGEGGGSSILALDVPLGPGSPDLFASLVPGTGEQGVGRGD